MDKRKHETPLISVTTAEDIELADNMLILPLLKAEDLERAFSIFKKNTSSVAITELKNELNSFNGKIDCDNSTDVNMFYKSLLDDFKKIIISPLYKLYDINSSVYDIKALSDLICAVFSDIKLNKLDMIYIYVQPFFRNSQQLELIIETLLNNLKHYADNGGKVPKISIVIDEYNNVVYKTLKIAIQQYGIHDFAILSSNFGFLAGAAALGVVGVGVFGMPLAIAAGGATLFTALAPFKSKKAMLEKLKRFGSKKIDGKYAANLKEAEIEIERLSHDKLKLIEELRIAEERIQKLNLAINDVENQVNNYPFPIAYAIKMVENATDPAIMVEKLRRALGIALRYFAVLVFSDYHESGCFCDTTNDGCTKTFMSPVTDGAWLTQTVNVVKAYKNRQIEPKLIKEIHDLWIGGEQKNDFLNMCNQLVKLRNEVHSLSDYDSSTAEEWLGRAKVRWDKMLAEASPLFRYRLFFLERPEEIEDDEYYVYSVKWLVGDHMIPRSEKVRWQKKLKKEKLYLMDPENGKTLCINPFLMYENHAITKSRETFCIEQAVKGKLIFSPLRFTQTKEMQHDKMLFTKI